MANDFEKQVEIMKKMAIRLVPYSVPRAYPDEERVIEVLKRAQSTVDGYEINLFFGRHDYGGYFLDALQIQSRDFDFLPFHVVCKIGKAFLGDTGLAYLEFMSDKRKVYCWTIKHSDGELIPPKTSFPGAYEGFEFMILNHDKLEI